MHLVNRLINIEPYKLTLEFITANEKKSPKEIREIDFTAFLKDNADEENSVYRLLLDPVWFQKVRLDVESQTIGWNLPETASTNYIDFCPDVLYQMSVQQF